MKLIFGCFDLINICSIDHKNDGIDSSAISPPHTSKLRLSSYVPCFYCNVTLCYFSHVVGTIHKLREQFSISIFEARKNLHIKYLAQTFAIFEPKTPFYLICLSSLWMVPHVVCLAYLLLHQSILYIHLTNRLDTTNNVGYIIGYVLDTYKHHPS